MTSCRAEEARPRWRDDVERGRSHLCANLTVATCMAAQRSVSLVTTRPCVPAGASTHVRATGARLG